MKRILAVFLAVMLLAAVIPATSLAAEAAANCSGTKVYRVHICGGRLKLYAGPSADEKVVTTLCDGKPLKFIKQSGSWYKVKTFKGVTGWVHKKNVKAGAYANVKTKNTCLNYRKGPGKCYAVKGGFAHGTKHLLVTKISGNWAYASKGGKCGWCCRDYLKWAC